MAALSRSSRSILNRHTAPRFAGDTLFERIARAVCAAECLPRKELYEAWETARRLRRVMRGGSIVELAAGHGLLSMILMLLDDTSPDAVCVDIRQPESFSKLLEAMQVCWPRLEGRLRYREGLLEDAPIPVGGLVVSVHACGELTDRVLDRAIAGRHRVAVLPCCHDLARCDTGDLQGWLEGPLAVDVTRAARLRAAGYRVRTQTIPEEITPKNRLLLGEPQSLPGD